MSQCPLAYADPCSECAQYGSCCPSQAAQRLEILEKSLQEIKKMLMDINHRDSVSKAV